MGHRPDNPHSYTIDYGRLTSHRPANAGSALQPSDTFDHHYYHSRPKYDDHNFTTTTSTHSTTSTTAQSPIHRQHQERLEQELERLGKGFRNVPVYSGTINKGTTIDVSGLAVGTYHITATTNGRGDVTQDPTVPAQEDTIVLTIL